jgi:hypothetical protein
MKHLKKQLLETLLHLTILATIYRYPTRNDITSSSQYSNTRDPLLFLNRPRFDINSIDHLIRLKETDRIGDSYLNYYENLFDPNQNLTENYYRRPSLTLYPAFFQYTDKFIGTSNFQQQQNQNQNTINSNTQANDNNLSYEVCIQNFRNCRTKRKSVLNKTVCFRFNKRT